MKLTALTFVWLVAACGGAAVAPPPSPAAEEALPPGVIRGTDRTGSDYKDFDLAAPDFKLCLAACLGEAGCKAWTYVKPGAQGDKARCWLKSAVPAPTPDDNCISGMRVGDGSTVEK